jgi:hypothetical protein
VSGCSGLKSGCLRNCCPDNPVYARKSTHQDYLIDQEVIEGFKQHCFWDDMVSILTQDQKNEIEEAISNAVYWIGEAQNEWIPQIAFVKFWTAIEALTYNQPNNKKVTDAILTNATTLLIFGGYHYFPLDQYWDLRKNIDRLYDKRSQIIHRGILEEISWSDLNEICSYSTKMASEFLGLKSIGYTKFDQAKTQAIRLHENQVRVKLLRENK